MPETPRQRRTAASVIEDIENRLVDEQKALKVAENSLAFMRERVATLEGLLEDLTGAEPNKEAE